MASYYERVARAMKATYSAGSMNTYDYILEKLHERFPVEQELRDHIEQMEANMRRFVPRILSSFATEGTMPCAHCWRTVVIDRKGPPQCPERGCGATVETT